MNHPIVFQYNPWDIPTHIYDTHIWSYVCVCITANEIYKRGRFCCALKVYLLVVLALMCAHTHRHTHTRDDDDDDNNNKPTNMRAD